MGKCYLLAFLSLFLVGCFGGGDGETGSASVSELKEEMETLSASVRTLEERRTELRKERGEKKIKASRVKPRSQSKSSSSTAKKEEQTQAPGEKSERWVEAENYVATLENSLAEIESQIDTWRQPTRTSFEGLPFKGLQLENGEEIPVVTIGKVTDFTLTVIVDGQPRALPWEDLAEKSRLALLHEATVSQDALY